MKKVLAAFYCGISLSLFNCSPSLDSANKINNSVFNDSLIVNIENWKRATIHLECATNSISYQEQSKRYREMNQKFRNGEISFEEYADSISNTKSRDLRYQGTAIFINYKSKKYLATARHVLHDTLEARRYIESQQEWNSRSNRKLSKYDLAGAQNKIFNIIFRVRSLNEYVTNKDNNFDHPEFLMNVGAGSSSLSQYTFSDPYIDLAVISLEREMRFLEDLENSGYKAIKLDSTWCDSINEGDPIFCIGFPQTTSLIDKLNLSSAALNWSSPYMSLPTVSFGNVAMDNDRLKFFWGDMSIYPGNSGGPVIKNNKLVGIISRQATYDSIRVPFAFVVKIEHLFPLLEEQIKKDNAFFH